MISCPYCGSHNIQTTGGEYGNPFDRSPEKTICLECGRTISEDEPKKGLTMPDLSAAGRLMDELENAQRMNPVIVIEMTANASGITRTARVEFPYKDGVYPLSEYDYPFPRFDRIIIDGDRLDLDGEISKITSNIMETEKHFIAYGLDRYGWNETVKIKIYLNLEKEIEQ